MNKKFLCDAGRRISPKTGEKNKPAGICNRRQVMKWLASAAGLLPFFYPEDSDPQFRFPGEAEMGGVPPLPTFFFAQLMYGSDLSWNPYPTAVRNLMEFLVRRTSVQASPDRVDLRLSDPRLFYYPFLYWTGTREFPPLSELERERLRLFLESGGFILVDDALSAAGVGFDLAFQREMMSIFPGKSLARLPEDHTIYRSYYLIDKVVGRTANFPFLLGLDQDDRSMLVYSRNDLGGTWARDPSGRWSNPVEPGGEKQRDYAIRLSINIILYALCLNYKKDLVHVPFIEKRRKERK